LRERWHPAKRAHSDHDPSSVMDFTSWPVSRVFGQQHLFPFRIVDAG
jgi:hypothetical protein